MSTGWVLVDVLGFGDLDNSPAGLQWQLVVMETKHIAKTNFKAKNSVRLSYNKSKRKNNNQHFETYVVFL